MAPINESREEEAGDDGASQRKREVHQLEALWADFRLPVPLATPGKARPRGGDDARYDDERAAWRLRAVDLLRLLHAMGGTCETPPVREEHGAAGEPSAESQATLARALLAAAERTFPSSSPRSRNGHGADDRLLQKLRQETEETCAKFHHWLERHQRGRTPERDLIYDIFLAPPTVAMDPTATAAAAHEEELLIDGSEDENLEEDGGGNIVSFEKDDTSPTATATQRQPARQPAPPTAAAVDPVAFQKEQQELLEAELASMATLLKSSTLAMNATLQTQTQDLDHMEELAQTNLDEVTRTTKQVEERLAKKKGWKKRLARWSLIGMVLGMWVVCFLVIRTVPKRQRVRIVYGKKDGGGPSLVEQIMTGGRRTWQRLFPQPLWEEDGEDEEEEGERRHREAAQRDNAQREARRRHRENVQQERARRQEERQRRQGQGGKEERRRPSQGRSEEECEVLADGTQVCGPLDEEGRTEAKVRALAAERRRQRIATNMAKARTVEAVDSTAEPEEPEEEDDEREEEDYDYRERGSDENRHRAGEEFCHKEDDGGCLAHDELGEEDVAARDARRKAARDNAYEEERRRRIAEQERRDDFHREEARRGEEEQRRLEEAWRAETLAKQEEDEARARREVQRVEGARAAAEAARQAELERLEEERHYQEKNTAEQRKREGEEEARRAAEEREARRESAQLEHERLAAVAARKAERKRLEEERLYQEEMLAKNRKNEEEKARILSEEQARMEAERVERARVEAQRQEQARLAAEVARKAEQERLERERIEQERIMAEQREKEEEEARRIAEEQVERERLVAATAKKEELERLERERVEQERIMAEQRKKEEEESRRLAEEQARLEAERVERERLVAEAAKKEEEARQLADAKAEAARAMELSKDIAADNGDFLPSDVRLAAGRRRNDLLAHYITASPETVDAVDRSGWSPLHEAARAGNLGGVQLLLSAGCDLTARTGRAGRGGTALWWAVQRYGENHGVVQLLRAHDALEEGPA